MFQDNEFEHTIQHANQHTVSVKILELGSERDWALYEKEKLAHTDAKPHI